MVSLLEGSYEFRHRGVLDVKGKGVMETWFLEGRREAPLHLPVGAALSR